jgi:hypothetical protein
MGTCVPGFEIIVRLSLQSDNDPYHNHDLCIAMYIQVREGIPNAIFVKRGLPMPLLI